MTQISKPLSSIVEQPVVGSDVLISGITLDSRSVEAGNLFCAMKGECSDGHLFIHSAVEHGAAAVAVESGEYVGREQVSYVVSPVLKEEVGVIASRFYDEPTKKMSVIGVTGTNGKTSISSYVAQLNRLLGNECGEIGTLGVRYSSTVQETKNTTPDAITLQHYFYDMHQQGIDRAVMEVSSHAMVQNRCKGVSFTTAVYSNLSHDHLDYHGSFEAYLAAKLQLFSLPDLAFAVVNLDDDYSQQVIGAVNKGARLITYSLANQEADVFLTDVSKSNGNYKAILNFCGEKVEIETVLVGEFNLCNLMAAVIAVREQGYSLSEVAGQCKNILPVAGRMQLVKNGQGIMAVVDYAHTPDALENVLKSLKEHISGRVITVFGCGGDRDQEKRPLMGKIADHYSDYVVITADNPRSESVDLINQQIVNGMQIDSKNHCVLADRKQAIRYAVDMAEKMDCILVAGKGHEKKQIIGDVALPFDDVEVLAEALACKGALP